MVGNVPGATVAPSQKSFDLSNQTDVLALLNYVRRSELDPDLQNELRNLTLDYTSQPDPALLQNIQTTLQPLGITITVGNQGSSNDVVEKSPVTTKSPIVFGRQRSKPLFNITAAASSQPTSHSSPLVANKVNPAPAVAEPATTPPPEPPPEPAANAAPVPSAPAAETTPVKVTVNAPAKVEAPSVTPAPATAPVAESAEGFAPLERIKAIKRAVNVRVGNPVNLIAANNDVGREYMSALLDAMKQTTSGDGAALTTAMSRLETAFATVESTLDNSTQTNQADAPTAPATAAPEKNSPPPAPEAPTAAVVTNPPKAAVTPTPVAAPPEPPKPVVEAPIVVTPPPVAAPKVDTTQPAEPQPPAGLQSLAADLHALDTVPVTENTPQTTPADTNSPTPTPQVETASLDPLMDSKITAGLEQLLSEWSLFKSSGIFGTGPSGREHPLYKNLSTLPMASVISGRYEGSTPEIKQSLADYMNGWRYEQGMTHEIDETFENYLRRVIQAILAKQSKTT